MSGEGVGSQEQRLRAIVRDVSYKGWKFDVGADGYALFYVRVRFGAHDATSGTHTQWNGRKWRLSPHMTVSEVVQTCLKAVLTAEEHEAREGFLWRGRAVFGPHLSVERLWELANDTANLDVREG